LRRGCSWQAPIRTFSEEMNRNKTKQAKKLARVVAGAETSVEEGAAVRAGASAGGGLELL
jgi:hypothetical protein